MAYKTIKEHIVAEFVEKKSRFIGNISPVTTNEEAVDFINKIKSEHKKATHNVYAYILRDGNIVRYSDDGEPQGTAAIPVLEVLQKEGLTDVCVVATRYFGGIMLGGGGLVRAYSHCCAISVHSAKIMDMRDCYSVTAKMDYNLYGKINYIIPEFSVKMLDTDFSDEVTMTFLVKSEVLNSLWDKFIDISNGQISLSKSDEMTADFA